MGKKKVILILVFVVLLCAGGLIVFILHRQKWKPPKPPELLELPEKESLMLSEQFSIEDIHYVDGIVKVKFSNASEDEYDYYFIEAKGLEVWQEGGWKELYYVRWNEDIYRMIDDYTDECTQGCQYGVGPDWQWLKYGYEDDSKVNLLRKDSSDIFIIKTAKEKYGTLEKGEYRVFYIVSDEEKAVEIAYQTFSVE